MKAVYVYKIIRGSGGVKVLGDGYGLEFETNVSPAKFSAVKINGELIDSSKYLCQADGTLILTEGYLDTLAVGSYTVTLVYQYGEASATFSVTEPGADMTLIIALTICGVGVVGVAVAYFVNRRRLLG